ncbi:MAG: sugar transferase [Lachnospiraceae bacterium]|nr:sugar transferase [Lachnospiraceae bacterium]
MKNESYVNPKALFYINFVKRPVDMVLALLAIVLLSPVLLITALLVRVKLGSPVIFRQQRPGKDNKIFGLMKFRSMTDERDEKGELKSDEERLTSFGKTLRSLSLDELPEFFNILKGDMSFVGPRPLLVRYLPRYDKEQIHRHDVLPGLTGLAQVKGRNAITWEEKFAYDLEYVRNVSPVLDIKILFMTVFKVFKREGISSATNATMEEFWGNEKGKEG